MRTFLLLIFAFLFFNSALAEDSLQLKAIRQTVATAFSQSSLSIDQLKWVSLDKNPSAVSVAFIPGSLEWVRVSDSLAYMRAVAKVTSVASGTAEYLGQLYPLRHNNESGKYEAEILTVVRLDPQNPIRVRTAVDAASFQISFASESTPSSVGIDGSCSPYRLGFNSIEPSGPGLGKPNSPHIIYIGCRDIHDYEEGNRRPIIEVELDMGTQSEFVTVEGQKISVQDGVLRFRLNSDTHSILVQDPIGRSYEVSAQIPPRYHYLNFGFGLGPYRQLIQSPIESTEGVATLATIYGSYFVTESSRIVFFNATSVKAFFFSDNGLYFNSESFRILDRRMSVNLMLGLNAVGLGFSDATRFRIGFPQGVEMIFRDAFQKNATLQAGAFIYPKINSSAYYNIWLRYGKSGFFGELNYISVRDEFGSIPVYTRNFGVSIGFPLARFL